MIAKKQVSNLSVLISIFLGIVCTLGFRNESRAATLNLATCAQTEVVNAINLASVGDVVSVPAGNCTWSGFSISKGISLQGAGSAATIITLTGGMSITKDKTKSIELSGFKFLGTNVDMFFVGGEIAAEPPLIHDNIFSINNGQIMLYGTNGGVIYRNTFVSTRPYSSNGFSDDSGFQHKMQEDLANADWNTPDTMGTRDTYGKRNVYLEDNSFINMSTQNTDFDDGARVVLRFNTFTNAVMNSHGLDSSPVGVRHFEIYGNKFFYPDNTVNQNWMFWIRGGTGVIYNNSIDNIIGQMWGDKTEILLSVRMVNDGGRLGCATGYPAPHQIGQNFDGTKQFTDPLRFWGNTGSYAWGINQWENTCGLNINDYLQEGRDFIFASTPKAGYTAYPYPHPLRSGTSTTPSVTLKAPANLRVVP
ncbi:MAG: hypothetical protein ACXWRA_13745 [Pseudobdellovibrionaceae bacterium]